MARLFKLNDLANRKRALAAEAEVFRQTLRLELQNLRLCTMQARRAMFSLGGTNTLVLLTAALSSTFFRRNRFSPFRFLMTGVLGWQLYQRFVSPLRRLLSWRRHRNGPDFTVRKKAEAISEDAGAI